MPRRKKRPYKKPGYNAPGRAHREGISYIDFTEMVSDEETARAFFEERRWPGDTACPRCGSLKVRDISGTKQSMPWRCDDCKRYFSVRTNSVMEDSRIPLKKWAWAVYIFSTSLKGVSSMKLHRDLGIAQNSAWFLGHRLRLAMRNSSSQLLGGPVEVDETFFGGKAENRHEWQRGHKEHPRGGPSDRDMLIGLKDRATGEIRTEAMASQDPVAMRQFVRDHVEPGAEVYTDGHFAYRPLEEDYQHQMVNHSVGMYVLGMAHTNGIEGFWGSMKRAYTGTFHTMTWKHLQRYADEFSRRQALRELDTIEVMGAIVDGMWGKRLRYDELVD